MKSEIVSPTTSSKSAPSLHRRLWPLALLIALVALLAFGSSTFAQQCEPVDFTEDGSSHFPTIYVYATTATSGATIFATMGNHYIPADPTHNGGTPTGSTFICGGTFAVFYGDHKWFKAIAYKAGMTDSVLNIYEVDNSGL